MSSGSTRWCSETPETRSGYYVTGDAAFLLIISARDMEDYDTFTRQFFYNKPDIKSFKTMAGPDDRAGPSAIRFGSDGAPHLSP